MRRHVQIRRCSTKTFGNCRCDGAYPRRERRGITPVPPINRTRESAGRPRDLSDCDRVDGPTVRALAAAAGPDDTDRPAARTRYHTVRVATLDGLEVARCLFPS